ncbi:MAG: hypothetical protein A6D92_22480 [Symbiobacterium thermophilum]|uniref:Uncharacterized protein n=1 Tax=Symbiobacterium thermophilum TaxID=2734 RepID=A0A1Y2T2Y6_SYMTR|nr:MAG: hypothetical protein A6D92_22480 [Symbiobacterium thermophilum]
MSLGSAIPSFQAGGRYATQFTVAGNLAEAVVVIAVTVLVNALINAALDWYLHELAGRTDGTWDRELMPMIKKGVSAVVGFFALSIVLELFGISVSALIATAGVASAAIALRPRTRSPTCWAGWPSSSTGRSGWATGSS